MVISAPVILKWIVSSWSSTCWHQACRFCQKWPHKGMDAAWINPKESWKSLVFLASSLPLSCKHSMRALIPLLHLWIRVFHHLSAISKDGIHWMSKMTFAFYQIALHNFILSFKLNSNSFAVKFTFEQTKVNLFFVWKSSHLCKNFAYFPRNGY